MARSTEPLMIDMAALDSEDRLAQSPVEAEQFRQRAFALAVAAEKANPLVAKPVSGARDRLTELGFTDVLLHLDLLAEGDRESALAVGIRALGEPDQKTDEWVRWKL